MITYHVIVSKIVKETGNPPLLSVEYVLYRLQFFIREHGIS